MCQYNLTTLGGDVVIDALNTHPVCILSRAIHQNPYYIEPEIFMEGLRKRKSSDPNS